MRIPRHIQVHFVFFTVQSSLSQKSVHRVIGWIVQRSTLVLGVADLTANPAPQTSLPVSKTDQALSQLRVFPLAVPSAWNALHPSPKSELEPSHPSDLRVSSWFSHTTTSHQSVRSGSAATVVVVTALFSVSNGNKKLVIAAITLPSLTPSIMPRTWSEPSKCLRVNESGDSVLHRALIRHT